MNVSVVSLFTGMNYHVRYSGDDRPYQSGIDVDRTCYADLGDEGVCVDMDYLIRHTETFEELSESDLVFVWVYEDFLDFRDESPAVLRDRSQAKQWFNAVGSPAASSVEEVVAKVRAPVILLSQHGNFEESFMPMLREALPDVRNLLSAPNVVGWSEVMPRHYQLVKSLLGKVVFLPWPYQINVVVPNRVPRKAGEPPRIYVARPFGGEGYSDNGLAAHVAAEEIGRRVGGARISYAFRVFESPEHRKVDEEVRLVMRMSEHACLGWLPRADVSGRLGWMVDADLFVHLGTRGCRTWVTSDAALVGTPAVVSKGLIHEL
mgnify:FL=1